MISSSFTTTACALAVVFALIRFGRRRGAATDTRYGAIVIAVLAVAALLHIVRPNVPCVRLNGTSLTSLR